MSVSPAYEILLPSWLSIPWNTLLAASIQSSLHNRQHLMRQDGCSHDEGSQIEDAIKGERVEDLGGEDVHGAKEYPSACLVERW